MTDQRPVFDQVNIVARDMDAAVAFYRRLGLDIPDRAPAWDPHHRSAEVESGADLDIDSEVFAQQWDAGWPGATRGGCVLGFKLASRAEVDRVYADLTGAGYRGQQEPWDAFWGARYAIVEDPDGNAVGLMSPVDPARRRDSKPPS
jgi:catechol 2,3-dioxygenase-like lactoylglutathione lyase family enzyme